MSDQIVNDYMLLEGMVIVFFLLVIVLVAVVYQKYKRQNELYIASKTFLQDYLTWFSVNVLLNPSPYYGKEEFSIDCYTFKQDLVTGTIVDIVNIDTNVEYMRNRYLIYRNFSYKSYRDIYECLHKAYTQYTDSAMC